MLCKLNSVLNQYSPKVWSITYLVPQITWKHILNRQFLFSRSSWDGMGPSQDSILQEGQVIEKINVALSLPLRFVFSFSQDVTIKLPNNLSFGPSFLSFLYRVQCFASVLV